jgi:peptide chain release factor 1
MFDKLNGVETRFVELEKILSDPEVVKVQETYQRYIREHAELIDIVTIFRKYKHILESIGDSMELILLPYSENINIFWKVSATAWSF